MGRRSDTTAPGHPCIVYSGRVTNNTAKYLAAKDIIYAAGWAAVVVHTNNVALADIGTEYDFSEIVDPHPVKVGALAQVTRLLNAHAREWREPHKQTE